MLLKIVLFLQAVGIVALILASETVVADEPCLMCHRGEAASFTHRTHEVACASCHGASESHLKNPMKQAPDSAFSGSGADEACVACHSGRDMMFWQGSGHEMGGTACRDCHSEHKPLAHDDETALCTSCHQSLKSAEHMPSRHPIAAGQMGCTDCHNPHGTANESLLTGDIPTDACTSCHAEYRGPFLFEHDPVTEDCGICHKPHGSVQQDLLVARPPFLCQQCHQAANHPAKLADGTSLMAGSTNLVGGSCLNCHSRIHGSNHPSGARLTR